MHLIYVLIFSVALLWILDKMEIFSLELFYVYTKLFTETQLKFHMISVQQGCGCKYTVKNKIYICIPQTFKKNTLTL